MIYVPQHFSLQELLPKRFYTDNAALGDRLWLLFDQRLLVTLDGLRDRYGPLQANTWKQGGEHQYRGWRPFDCKVGERFSQHKFGRAADVVPLDSAVTAANIRTDIRSAYKQDPIFRHITAIEDTVSWLHIDVRNWTGLLIVHPKS